MVVALVYDPLTGNRHQFGTVLEKGYDVFRFDFEGMGNSKGNVSASCLDTWHGNLMTALTELLEIAGKHIDVSLVAPRFAAVLAAKLSYETSIANTVMWDPVLCGSDWLGDLASTKRAMQSEMPYACFGQSEYAGYDLGHTLVEELSAQQLGDFEGVNSTKAFAVLGGASNSMSMLTNHSIEFECTQMPYSWTRYDLQIMYLHEVVNTLVARF